ncbi:glycoside hydrolase family 3 protein [Weeksella virosa]|uniref:glycoside hydrolase family 3 protein n=1 Tax=Weeksella virosa TaxID=1014 RepID=UPI002552DD4D|nr:glycoside hydrolase family 3 protein [Weeksella virosa]MDK7674638.1 glycoside hydrolase family 3 protein [Weeksella virosa]
MKNFIIVTITGLLFTISVNAQRKHPLYMDTVQLKWVNDTYDKMSMDERVGQLFMVAAFSNRDAEHEAEIEKLVREEKIGGLIFMQDQAARQIELTNRYQKISKIPLLIGMDAEWGLAQRLKDVKRFPWNITLGALRRNILVYNVGKSIADQANRMGVKFDFAPSVDVNVNPNNPIIGNRSFGSDPENVWLKGEALMRGLQKNNVLSSAKHFPGHGDTDQDSHKTLPIIHASKEELEKYHIRPFMKMIRSSVPSIMVSHLDVPALDSSGVPATLSSKIITDYLKGTLKFRGIIITDALNMEGVTKGRSAGEIDYLAFKAGNDILLFSQKVKDGKAKILEGLTNGSIPQARLEESVKKILLAKYKVGLTKFEPIDTTNVLEDLNKKEYADLTRNIFEEATTLLKNQENVLPIDAKKQPRIAFVPLERKDYHPFFQRLNTFSKVDLVEIESVKELSKLKKYDYVIIGAFMSDENVYQPYTLSKTSKDILTKLPANKKYFFSLFTSPYGLKDLDVSKIDALLVQYQNTLDAQEASAKAIFGEIVPNGVLPVDVNSQWKAGDGILQLDYVEFE